MLTIDAQVLEYQVSVSVENENKPCLMQIRLLQPWDMVIVDGEFPNAKCLSAQLASTLGYGPACDLLHAFDVPRTSMLWHLNHEGWSPPVAETVARVVRLDQPAHEAPTP
jgi:hypothetical protein